MVILFLIAYLSSKDVSAALLVSVGLTVTLLTLNHHKVNNAITNILNLKQEAFMPNNPRNIPYGVTAPGQVQADSYWPVQQKQTKQVRFEEAFDGAEYANI
jgi:hypothetical protein